MSAPFEPSASDLPPLPAQVHEPFLNASHGPWIESPVRAPIWRPGDLPAIPFGGSSDEQDGSLFPGAWPGRGPGSDQADLDRKGVVSGKSVSVRLVLGGLRIIKKKKTQSITNS